MSEKISLTVSKLLDGSYGWDISLAIYTLCIWFMAYFNPGHNTQEELSNLYIVAIILGIGACVMFVARMVERE
jgi:hypothetical protein